MEFVVVRSLICVWLFGTPWTAARQASLFFTISQSLLKLMSIESVMPSNHLMLCRLLLLLSIFPSIRVFSNESALRIRWPKYWSFSFSISPSSEYLGLISFRIDCLDLHVVQGTLKSLIQHHNSKASILQLSLWSNSHIHTWLLEKPYLWLYKLLISVGQQTWVLILYRSTLLKKTRKLLIDLSMPTIFISDSNHVAHISCKERIEQKLKKSQ